MRLPKIPVQLDGDFCLFDAIGEPEMASVQLPTYGLNRKTPARRTGRRANAYNTQSLGRKGRGLQKRENHGRLTVQNCEAYLQGFAVTEQQFRLSIGLSRLCGSQTGFRQSKRRITMIQILLDGLLEKGQKRLGLDGSIQCLIGAL